MITKGQFDDGLKEGDWVYQLGNYKSIGKYMDDMQDSIWTEYYNDNGQCVIEANIARTGPMEIIFGITRMGK